MLDQKQQSASSQVLNNNNNKSNYTTQSIESAKRVNQLDAEDLDLELINLLIYQVRKIFKFFKHDFLLRYKPEIYMCIHSVIFRYTIYNNKQSAGNQLQNIQFIKLKKRQKILYWCLFVGIRYIYQRLSLYMTLNDWSNHNDDDDDANLSSSLENKKKKKKFKTFLFKNWKNKVYKLVNKIYKIYHYINVLNFCHFLVYGDYRNIIERILKIKLIYKNSQINRQISFEFLTQQLLWHGISEFFLFLLPLINFKRILYYIKDIFYMPHTLKQVNGCGICLQDPINTPYIASCKHIFCYYCIKSNKMNSKEQNINYHCPQCDRIIYDIKPYHTL